MKRRIFTFGRYFAEFMEGLTAKEREKVDYGLVLLKTQDRLPSKFVKHIRNGLYELRTEYDGNDANERALKEMPKGKRIRLHGPLTPSPLGSLLLLPTSEDCGFILLRELWVDAHLSSLGTLEDDTSQEFV